MKTSAITLLCFIAFVVAAQVPQAFKYQMVLRDTNGDVLSNQMVSLRISIHESTAGGSVIYQETFTETSNQFGLVNLEIGYGAVNIGDFTAIDWGGDLKFIETEIDPAGGTNYSSMGTSQLLAVPYALYSERSKDSPWELSGNDLYYNDGKIGLGVSTPLFTMDVRNPTAGETADVGAHSNDAGGALSAYSSSFPAPYNHFAGRLSLWSNAFTASGIDLRADGSSSDIRLFTGGFLTSNERMRITPDGYVGIGTTAPETHLHISNTAQFNPSVTLYGAKGSLLLTHINNTIQLGSYGPGIAFSGINTTRRRAAIASVETSADEDQVGLAFFTHPSTSATDEVVSETMRITHGGNVGIGQTSPETMMHINTDTRFNPGNLSGRERGSLLLSHSGSGAGYHQFGPALAFSGINTSRRRAALAAIQTDWDEDQVGLAFFTHPGTAATNDEVTQRMVITHDGLVGINTTTPTSRLDVTGNIAVRDESSGIIAVEIGTGLDYAEGFDVAEYKNIPPGTVLCIDSDHPGKLKISERAYDTKVAGIVAGANQLGSGVTLGKGQHDLNVALAGRVYCNAEATESAIEIGDLLTTSEFPGYAKKVTDPSKAQGAVLGKAMQKLEKGEKGQVLVLVTLQ